MAVMPAEHADAAESPDRPERAEGSAGAEGSGGYRASTPVFLAALVARTWLWFVAGCIVITLLPLLLGWCPYVVESGSMQPRIDIGDVVLAAPEPDPQTLLGRVAVFEDPSRPGTTKTHRVVAVNPDGTLTTKGDANVGNDTAPVAMADVHGLGRLLVMFAGLPMVWLHTGQWLLLGLFLLSLVLAGWLVGKDRDEEGPDTQDADGAPGGPPGPGAELLPLPQRLSDGGSTQVAASRPDLLSRLAEGWSASRLGRRAMYASILTLALAVPTTAAAFAATTRSTANGWSVPNWDYTATIQSYSPYLYWKLDDTGATAVDSSGNNRTGTYAATVTRSVPGAFLTDTPNVGVTMADSTACVNTTSTTAVNAPQTFTQIAWFRAPSGYTQGGKIMGWETPRTGTTSVSAGSRYDRHVYMDGSGRVWFGVYNGGFRTLSTTAALNDGAWHMVAASLGPSGMALYVDGDLVGSATNNGGEATQVWFRAGCGNLAGWGSAWSGGNNPGTSTSVAVNRPFLGSLDEVSVHLSVLSATQIRQAFISR